MQSKSGESRIPATGVHLFGGPMFVGARISFATGEILEGSIEARWNPMLEQGVHITVACVHVSGESAWSLWADDVVVPASKISRTKETCRIPVTFELPADLPSSHGAVQWVIAMRAGNRTAKFVIPVYSIRNPEPAAQCLPTFDRKINVTKPGRGDIAAIRIDHGKILLGHQEIDATSINRIDVIASGVPEEMVWTVRLHTIGGKVIEAAPGISTRAGAERIAQKIEEILVGLDRKKIDELFGSPDRLHSTS